MSLYNTLSFIVRHPLNKGHKFRALSRFLKWQIGSRLVPGQVLFEWINGSRIVVKPGETGLTGNIYCGLDEFPDMGYLLHVLNPEDLFIDVGANVGSYTVLACAVKGAKGVCFEPVPATFERLLDNLRINGLEDRVTAMNLGLSDGEGELLFTTGENCTNHVIAKAEASSAAVQVKVRSLDAVLAGQMPSVMKIDVEGFETPVLSGALELLRRESLHSVIMELNGSGDRYGYDEGKILKLMAELGFSTYAYEPFSRTLRAIDGKNRSSGNTLFIRDAERVGARLKGAPRIQVAGVFI